MEVCKGTNTIQPIGKIAFQPNWYNKISHTYANYEKEDIIIAEIVDEKGTKTSHCFQMSKHLNNISIHLLKTLL